MLKKSSCYLIAAYALLLFVFYQLLMLNISWSDTMAENYSSPDNDVTVAQREEQAAVTAAKETEYLLIGEKNGPVASTARNALDLMRLKHQTIDTLVDIRAEYPSATTLLITTPLIDGIGDANWLLKANEDGIVILFCVMPDTRSKAFNTILPISGILSATEKMTQPGFDIFHGILLGGMFRTEELEVECQRVFLNGTCKVYASGYTKGLPNEENIPLMWRTYANGTPVFFVNNNWTAQPYGIGIITGLLCQVNDVAIYPIINSRVAIIENFPLLSSEYDHELQALYNRNTRELSTTIWADLLSSTRSLNLYPTSYALPYAHDPSGVDMSLLSYYARDFTKNRYELALGNPLLGEAGDSAYLLEAWELFSENLPN